MPADTTYTDGSVANERCIALGKRIVVTQGCIAVGFAFGGLINFKLGFWSQYQTFLPRLKTIQVTNIFFL